MKWVSHEEEQQGTSLNLEPFDLNGNGIGVCFRKNIMKMIVFDLILLFHYDNFENGGELGKEWSDSHLFHDR